MGGIGCGVTQAAAARQIESTLDRPPACINARGRTRTCMGVASLRILRPMRLLVSPPGLASSRSRPGFSLGLALPDRVEGALDDRTLRPWPQRAVQLVC